MKTKHTPGPWRLHANESDRTFQIVGDGYLPICTMETVVSGKFARWVDKKARPGELWRQVATEQEQANARLIDAAPNLLDTIERLLNAHDKRISWFSEELWDSARKAIAEALGNQTTNEEGESS